MVSQELREALSQLRAAVEAHVRAGGDPMMALALVLRVMVDAAPPLSKRLREAAEKKTWRHAPSTPAIPKPEGADHDRAA